MIQRLQNAIVSVLILPVLFGGCAATDDPTKGGLFGGLYGIQSGTYDQRLEARQESLEAVTLQKHSAEQEQAGLSAEKAAALQEKQALQAEMTKISQDSQRLSRELAKTKARSQAAKQKKAQAGKRLKVLNGQLKRLQTQAATGSESAASYQHQAQQLEQEIQQLWGIFHSLE